MDLAAWLEAIDQAIDRGMPRAPHRTPEEVWELRLGRRRALRKAGVHLDLPAMDLSEAPPEFVAKHPELLQHPE
jgi:hypothetical protein